MLTLSITIRSYASFLSKLVSALILGEINMFFHVTLIFFLNNFWLCSLHENQFICFRFTVITVIFRFSCFGTVSIKLSLHRLVYILFGRGRGQGLLPSSGVSGPRWQLMFVERMSRANSQALTTFQYYFLLNFKSLSSNSDFKIECHLLHGLDQTQRQIL